MAPWTCTWVRMADEAQSLRDYWLVLRRGLWLVAALAILAVVGAVAYSASQPAVYQAAAHVLVRNQNIVLTTAGIDTPSNDQTADRSVETQALLANSLEVAERAVKLAGRADVSPQNLLDNSDVAANPNADFVDITVSDHSKHGAIALANAYARAFVAYRQGLDQAQFRAAYKGVQDQLRALRLAGSRRSAVYAQLAAQGQQLKTAADLQARNLVFAQPAKDAKKTAPQPTKAAALALVLAISLGVALVYLRNALDTSVKGESDIATVLNMPLLGRISSSGGRRFTDVAMLSGGRADQAEAYRQLRTNLELANLSAGASSILITSGEAGEGKTVTASNLAIALARAGRRVLLLELDLRRPSIEKLFSLEPGPGFTDVALGDVDLEEALVEVPVSTAVPVLHYGDVEANTEGALAVLPSGTIPPDPGDFLTSRVVSDILDRLAHACDIVIVDSPPLHEFSDAMSVASKVDGVILVVRWGHARRELLLETRRLLEAPPAKKLGFVLIGAPGSHVTDYGPPASVVPQAVNGNGA